MFYHVQSPAPEVPNVDSLQTFRAEFPQLTPDEILRVRDLNNELAQDGFAEPVCYLIEPTFGQRLVVAAWRHESGESFVSVLLYAPTTQLNGAATITFVSAFAGDSFLV